MGTRSITTVRSRWEGQGDYETHAVIYRHFDGYLSAQGQLVYDFLNGLSIVNGINSDTPKRHANGPGRLAAMLVVEMEEEGVSPDLCPDTSPCGQEFHYQIDVDYGMSDRNTATVTVFNGPITAFGSGGEDCTSRLFHGTVEEFGKFLLEQNALA